MHQFNSKLGDELARYVPSVESVEQERQVLKEDVGCGRDVVVREVSIV
jgi:hypothetical protein